MPIYEIHGDQLSPFTRLHPGPELYEQEIEALVWSDLEAFTGEALFPVARQARISGGGVPDILALDESGRVVIVEVKRDIDRGQLAQCLEYAGWARLTNLDEISGLYDRGGGHSGPEAFFRDWQDFTESTTPVTINPQPRLYLVARDFEGRTRSALDFLRENKLPVTIVPVTMYADSAGRRIVDVEADHEPVMPGSGASVPSSAGMTPAERQVTVADLLESGVLQPDERVEFPRPRLGDHYTAVIRSDGRFELPDGTSHGSPSRAAMSAADVVSYDGWHAWRVPRLGGAKLHELRIQYAAGAEGGESSSA